MTQPQPIPNLVGYYASPEGIHSAAKNGETLKVDGRRSTSAVVKTRHGRLSVFTLLLITLGPTEARAWAATHDADRRAAWLRFRRDNPRDEANTWGPLSVDELEWLADYDKENHA